MQVYFKFLIMKISSLTRYFSLALLMLLAVSVCDAQSFSRPPRPKQQKSVSKKPLNKKETKTKITGSRAVVKAQKKQSANDKRLKKEYEQYVQANRKRSLEIQTPEVRERMKQNVKDADNRAKEKRKAIAAANRKAAKKYR